MRAPSELLLRVTPKQARFITSQAKISAYIGGIRSGKTWAGSGRALTLSSSPGILGLVLGPTFPQLRDSTLRTFREVAGDWVKDVHKTEMLVTLWNDSQLLFRSMDNPDSIRGITAAWAWLDEARDMDESAFLVALGRLSQGGKAGPLFVTSSPAGIDNWLHTKFVTELEEYPDRELIQTSIYENTYLSPEFIATLEKEYVGAYAEQELGGLFVDLGGTLFKREWFIHQLDDIPLCEAWVRSWDLATSPQAKADYTAGALLGLTERGEVILADMVRDKLEWPDVQELIVSTALDDGPEVPIVIESNAMGLGAVQEVVRRKELLGHTIVGHRSDKGKYQRAMGWAARAKAGTFKVARRHWTAAFIGECLSFTGKESSKLKDDQIDAVSQGVPALAEGGIGVYFG